MITLIPVGGLANRMKAIDAAVALAQDIHTNLTVIWYKDQGLNCRFDELFQPLNIPGVKIKEASLSDLFLYDRPRKKNLRIPGIFQQLTFDACIYEEEATRLFYKGFDFKQWATNKKVYIASCVYFYLQPDSSLFKIFRPIPAIQKKIDAVTNNFNNSTWGIHIRRTDNTISIQESPTEIFIEWMNKQIQRQENSLFYLATDSEEDKSRLKNLFKERIITSTAKAERNSSEGMRHALTELYVLSRTKEILGSSHSSYSETAAQICNIPYQVARMKK